MIVESTPGTAVSTCDTIQPMNTLELTLQIIAFGLVLWLGLYLISRNPKSARLLLAGLGLVTYSVGLMLELLARFAPDQPMNDTLLGWQRPFTYLPAFFGLFCC